MSPDTGILLPSTRASRITIDVEALRHNLSRVKHYAPHSRVMAVIKANAYGIGARTAADYLEQADSFALATAAEAISLRRAGVSKPLVVLQGFADADEIRVMAELSIQPVIIAEWQIDVLQQQPPLQPLEVWLKVDTGMHRLGVPAADAERLYARLNACRGVAEIRLMSHFANADVPDNPYNNKQLEELFKVINNTAAEASMANSAGLIAIPESRLQWVRPGIMLYGSSPLADKTAEQLELRAVMNFDSRLLAVQSLNKGDAIGYGSTWQCPQAMRVGVVAAGYADGYPRHAPSATPVWVNGVLCPLVGRVSMDSITVDLGGVDAGPGDRVVLWGKELPVDSIAQAAGTIAYELLCRAGHAAACPPAA